MKNITNSNKKDLAKELDLSESEAMLEIVFGNLIVSFYFLYLVFLFAEGSVLFLSLLSSIGSISK